MKTNNNKRICVYAGTFDPVANGHLWMIETGAKLFDELVVAVGVNPDKKCLFSLDERLEMLRSVTACMTNVCVRSFSNSFLLNYAQQVRAGYILRGIRNSSDYEYEKAMRNINGDINSEITTVFLLPPREVSEVSSSMVKGLVGPKDWESVVTRYVPKAVLNKLRNK